MTNKFVGIKNIYLNLYISKEITRIIYFQMVTKRIKVIICLKLKKKTKPLKNQLENEETNVVNTIGPFQ